MGVQQSWVISESNPSDTVTLTMDEAASGDVRWTVVRSKDGYDTCMTVTGSMYRKWVFMRAMFEFDMIPRNYEKEMIGWLWANNSRVGRKPL